MQQIRSSSILLGLYSPAAPSQEKVSSSRLDLVVGFSGKKARQGPHASIRLSGRANRPCAGPPCAMRSTKARDRKRAASSYSPLTSVGYQMSFRPILCADDSDATLLKAPCRLHTHSSLVMKCTRQCSCCRSLVQAGYGISHRQLAAGTARRASGLRLAYPQCDALPVATVPDVCSDARCFAPQPKRPRSAPSG